MTRMVTGRYQMGDKWLSSLQMTITQSERLSKYNRLLAIERDLRLPVAT